MRNNICRKFMPFLLALAMVISLLPAVALPAGAIGGYDYVITGTAGSYNVYSSVQGADSFSQFGETYTDITAAVSAVTTEVGSDAATLYFGETGTGTSNLDGTLDIGSDTVNLGSSGTYTLKGGLTGSAVTCVLNLEGVSVIVDGATLTNTSDGDTILTNGVGSVTIQSGTVSSQGKQPTIYINGGSAGTTVLEMMTGGSVINTYTTQTAPGGPPAGVAIFNESSGNVKIRGGTVTSAYDAGIINFLTGDIYVSGGTITGATAGVYNGNKAAGHIHLSSAPTITGSMADIYTDQPGAIVANDGASPLTYYSGAALKIYYDDYYGVTPDYTVAVSGIDTGESGNSDKFTCANTDYDFTLSSTDLVLVEKAKTYDYAITGSASSCNVYRSDHDADSFSVLDGSPFSTITAAVSAVTTAVGSGSATLYFGATGTTASSVSGTLDIGSEDVELGSSGTYTLKGDLTCSDDSSALKLEGASAVVDGAVLENTGLGRVLHNEGAGSITVLSGTLTSLGSNAINSNNESGSSGAITITGGTITGSGDGLATIFLGDSANADASLTVNGGSIIHEGRGTAVTNEGTGEINISGGSLRLSKYSGQFAALVVSNSCTVNISGNALLDNDGPGAAIGIFTSDSSPISPVINITGGHIKSAQAGYAIYSYDYFAGTVNISGGTVENTGTGDAVYNGAGDVKISGGTVTGGTGRYGVYNVSNGCVYLSLTPSITGGAAGLYTASESTISANDGETSPSYYSGAAVSVEYGGSITADNTVAVSGVVGNSDKFTCANPNYSFSLIDTNLVIAADSSVWDGTTITAFTVGDGTSAAPYQIATAEQLAYLAKQLNDGAEPYMGTYFKLTDDIVLNDESFSFDSESGIVTVTDGTNTGYLGTGILGSTYNTSTASTAGTWYTSAALTGTLTAGSYSGTLNPWTPIGTASRIFSGTFDGNNKTVKGVCINSSGSDYQGLFGVMREGNTVQNVIVENSVIIGDLSVGGIIGSNSGTVTHCSNSGIVIGREAVGGIAGADTYGTVSYCYNAGAVSSSSGRLGGVVGMNRYGTVEYCYNVGAVKNTGIGSDVGGVVGSNVGDIFEGESTIKNCYNAGSVTSNGAQVGGIAGSNEDSCTVSYCYNVGAISITNGSGCGSVVGQNVGTVTSCYYDEQMCPTGTGGASTSAMTDGTTSSAYTGWDADTSGTKTWILTSGLYPRLTGYVDGSTDYDMEISDAAYVSASPITLSSDTETVNAVQSSFTVSTANGVGWASSDATVISVDSTTATVKKSGNVTLTATKGEVSRSVDMTSTCVSPVPTVLPTGGSFTDGDSDAGQISGTIGWTAANPTGGITGYHIYWGSDATTKLAGNTDAVYTVTGATTASQAVAADTDLSSGASYFLIYSYNANGDSASCLAVPITDSSNADYTVTNDTTDPIKYKVSGDNTVYATLSAALAVCTNAGGDNELTIQLGSAEKPLEVPQVLANEDNVDNNDPSLEHYYTDSDLVSATYTGSVKITAVAKKTFTNPIPGCASTDDCSSFGLRVPSGVTAVFKDLTGTAEKTSNGSSGPGDFSVVFAVGNLTITTGTSITVTYDDQSCVNAMGTYTIDPSQKITPATKATFTMDGGSLSSDDEAVYLAIANAQISGGTITSHGSGAVYSMGYADTQISGGTISGDENGISVSGSSVTISGSADIISAVHLEENESGTTVMLHPGDASSSTVKIFGTTFHANAYTSILINGVNANGLTDAANREIKSDNYTSAAVTEHGWGNYVFSMWTKDAELTTEISTRDDATNTITYLTTGTNAGVTDVYLKMIQPVPTVLPTAGSFTDGDGDKGLISGDIKWTAASPTDGITGYHIYWGSDATTKLANDTDVEYDVTSSLTESQTVSDNTDPPSGAKYFLIYSYNGGGDSATCLAVPITDVIGADYTVTNDTTDPSKYKVSGDDTVYATLSDALAVCTNAGGDNELVIQLGTDSTSPLQIPQVAINDSTKPNNLVSATYTGNLSILNKDITNTFSCGLYVPTEIEAHLSGLKIAKNINIDIPANMQFYAVCDLGTLYVEAGTDIQTTKIQYGVYAQGSGARFYMTGGSISHDTTGSGRCVYFKDGSEGEISSGTLSAAGDISVAINLAAGCSLEISGDAAISCSATSTSATVISTSGNLSIAGGTVSTSVNSEAIVTVGGSVTMTGGKVENTSSLSVIYGISSSGADVAISGGEIICKNANDGEAYGIRVAFANSVTVSGTANINVEAKNAYGIVSISTKTDGNGAAMISGGTIKANATTNGSAFINLSTGTVNISGGNIESNCFAIQNNAGGAVNITGGTVEATGTKSCINNAKGTVAISEANSGTPTKIISAGTSVTLAKGAFNPSGTIFGKTFHASATAGADITGAINAGKNEINKDNYGSATASATGINSPDVFTAWTSDAALQNSIGTTNVVTITSLTTGDNASVTDIYIKAVAPIPTVLPTNGSFTDGDSDAGQISGNITWTAASPTAGITGYKIYWGSDATTKLAGNSAAVYTVSGATTTSQAVAADTARPAGANYFLIYSYNSGGDSASCLAVRIMDLPYSYGGGSGTEADPYQISTADDLKMFASLVNSGTDYTDTYFKQTANINLNEGVTFTFDADTGLVEVAKQGKTTYWLGTGTKGSASGENTTFDTSASVAGRVYNSKTSTVSGSATFESNSWTPIGNSTNKFTGTFDGDGKTVSGIYINGASDYQGLFGFTDSGSTVKNTGVVNSYMKGGNNVGGVVGYNNFGTIQKCYNTGTVTGVGVVGGVVGLNMAGTVKNSYNTGTVTGSGQYVGGVVGNNAGPVEYSYNTGSVTGSNMYVGGVAGYTTQTIQYSCNAGKVVGNSSFVGGVSGDGAGKVKYCSNAGSVTGSGIYIGGVLGRGTADHCYYDSDKCAAKGIGDGMTSSDTDDQAEGKQTSAMQGGALKTGSSGDGWTTDHWTFKSGEYPKPGKTEASNTPEGGSSGGGSYVPSTPSKTITVTETSSALFSGSEGAIKAEANVDNAFSNSVEVKVTDTAEDGAGFGLGVDSKVYPFDISLYIKGTNTKTEPNAGYAVKLSLPIPEELLDVKDQLSIMHKSDDGTVETLNSQLTQINGVWYLVFEASEFSPYALVVKDIDTYDETAGLPYYVDSKENEVFIGFAANGKYIAPDGVTVLIKQNTKSFSDTGSHWAKNYIDFVTERELFTGTANNTFSPDAGMTRSMFATVIGRLYERSFGEIEAAGTHSFTDCDYDDYYGKYVDWAAKGGVIGGYGNGEFGPNDQITREQMAAILYRFADFLDVLPADMGAELDYPDAGDISSWSQAAALYCRQTGIITGRDGGSFAPQGTATRAEVAVILERFIENVLD